MKIAFVGKGGSGKSTLSTLMVRFLMSEKKAVLAIDADHNMDLSYNLGLVDQENHPYLGEAMPDILQAAGLSSGARYAEIFERNPEPIFRISEHDRDDFTKRYSTELPNGTLLMTSGPHTERVLYGQACSHVLSTPLKVYLPLLDLREDEYVVMDEKAGADGVGTGIASGIDFAYVVAEPSIHSVKAAKQIAGILDFYGTPYAFVGNKIGGNEDERYIGEQFGNSLVSVLGFSSMRGADAYQEHREALERLLSVACSGNRGDSLKRTIEKFRKNREFAEHSD